MEFKIAKENEHKFQKVELRRPANVSDITITDAYQVNRFHCLARYLRYSTARQTSAANYLDDV